MINGVSSQAIGSSITFFPFGIQSIFIIWFICQWACFLHTMKRHLCILYCWEVILYSQRSGCGIEDSLESISILNVFGKSSGLGKWGLGRCHCFVNPLGFHLAHFNSSHDHDNTSVVTEDAILDLNICHCKLDSFATLITLAELSGQSLPHSCLLAAHIWQGLQHPVAQLNFGPLLLNPSIYLCLNK